MEHSKSATRNEPLGVTFSAVLLWIRIYRGLVRGLDRLNCFAACRAVRANALEVLPAMIAASDLKGYTDMPTGEEQLAAQRRILWRRFRRWLMALPVLLVATLSSLFWVFSAAFGGSTGVLATVSICVFLILFAATILSLFFVIGTAGELHDHRAKHGPLKK